MTARDVLGLPPRVFFYHVDQIASLLNVTEEYVRQHLLYYQGRTPGAPPKDKIRATNLAPEGQRPLWRVEEKHLIMYLRSKGIRFQTRGYR